MAFPRPIPAPGKGNGYSFQLWRREMVLLGVDLRSSAKHPSAVAALNSGPEVVFLGSAHTDDELLQVAETLQPSLIAIGTPLGLPDGLCCLETRWNLA